MWPGREDLSGLTFAIPGNGKVELQAEGLGGIVTMDINGTPPFRIPLEVGQELGIIATGESNDDYIQVYRPENIDGFDSHLPKVNKSDQSAIRLSGF